MSRFMFGLAVVAVSARVWAAGVLIPAPGVDGQLLAPAGEFQVVTQLIVKYKDETSASHAAAASAMRALARSSGLGHRLIYRRPMSGLAHVLALPYAMTSAQALAVVEDMRRDPAVEYAAPDYRRMPLAAPNDPNFVEQWNLLAPTEFDPVWGQAIGGANVHDAWSYSTGSDVVIAVIDTGVVSHPDLDGNLVNGTPSASGYDFLSHPLVANDGDGRDPDPSDAGDWIDIGFCQSLVGLPYSMPCIHSSWHGTHVSGTIAAVTNNALGVAGIAHGAKVLAARVLGRCGGSDSEIVDAMRWAAGMDVPGVPTNVHPARVINLSLGGSTAAGPDQCMEPYRDAVADVRARGVVVVAATGNNGRAQIVAPASCAGVIAVTAHTIQGDSAVYANVGDSGDGTATSPPANAVTLSAPGGGPCRQLSHCQEWNVWPGIVSTCNRGTTVPDTSESGPIYASYIGTSMATPHVSAAVAMLLSMKPEMTPDEVQHLLTSTARPFPPGTYCAPGSEGEGKCGAGMLDVLAAVTEAARHAAGTTGRLGADPNPCTLSPVGICSTTLTWTSTAPDASVYVVVGPGERILVAAGPTGTAELPWITGAGYAFELHAGLTEAGALLDSLFVFGADVVD